MVFLWTPRASVKPYRHIDLRELQRSHEALFQLGVCGYPVDVSFMNRSGDPLRLIVLDSRRIIRILNAFSGELITVLSDDSASSVALGDMLVARYDPMDDRLLLGGKCLRVWEMRETDEHERNYTGHRKPVLYVTWHPTLNVFVTADEDHVVLWKIRPCVNQLAVERRQKRREMRKKIKEAAKLRATKEKKDLQLTVKDGEEEEKEEEEQNTSLSTSLMSEADPLTEVDEVVGISPTLCEDFNFFNHTYWSFETIIARSINIEEGVRTVTVDPSSTSVNIFVGLMRERAILHYNGFTGAKLRKFAYPDEVQELFCLTVGDVLLSRATAIPSPVLCAAFERYPKRGGGGGVSLD
ncbi:hypothetical protein ADEAN_000208300 [Angomonas deanei]|uniref:WD domain, G-beta repeat n=1 Tax=Angomonas deanei TaxID=59799 RepID=A0A7G2C9E8_9TRYP|nr:hypothetical protein ADEAN_000208300 [Angomonas deanei]